MAFAPRVKLVVAGSQWFNQRGNVKGLALRLIRLYQLTLSRVMPPSCRFIPTCSQYTYEAVTRHGFTKGVRLGIRRIAHCHPFHPGGYDPVP